VEDRQAPNPAAGLRARRRALCATRLQRRLPDPSRWYHNLAATDQAEIQVGPEHLAVRARTADPAERRRLFPRFVEMYKGYAAYEDRTSRQIPLVLLTPDRPHPTA
jgi:deazaflavin-dependent oxidoreductase (nitroreductase family)